MARRQISAFGLVERDGGAGGDFERRIEQTLRGTRFEHGGIGAGAVGQTIVEVSQTKAQQRILALQRELALRGAAAIVVGEQITMETIGFAVAVLIVVLVGRKAQVA